jgi:hypothetical protein
MVLKPITPVIPVSILLRVIVLMLLSPTSKEGVRLSGKGKTRILAKMVFHFVVVFTTVM